MIAELAFDIIDEIVILTQPRTCEGCRYLNDGDCKLYSCFCMNSIYKPYWETNRRENESKAD